MRRFEFSAGHHADLRTADQRLSPGRLVIEGRFEVAEPGGQFQ
ncbi:hypothetical protein [Saccharothrix sp.]|nr:hypothetical protein [Saccharothrix sp.]